MPECIELDTARPELGTSIYPQSFPRRRESMNTGISGNGGNLGVLFGLFRVHGFPPQASLEFILSEVEGRE
jgi:hypothetical protein